MEKSKEIVLFETEDKSVVLPVAVESETVWLSANQMAELFDRDEKTIRKHINNVFEEGEVNKDYNTQKMRVVGVTQLVPFYTLEIALRDNFKVQNKHSILLCTFLLSSAIIRCSYRNTIECMKCCKGEHYGQIHTSFGIPAHR